MSPPALLPVHRQQPHRCPWPSLPGRYLHPPQSLRELPLRPRPDWTRLASQCAGRNQTGIEVWAAQGSPRANGPVTASLAGTPTNSVISVSRYSGVAASNPVGNLVAGNTLGVNGACSGGVDSAAYSFNLTTTADVLPPSEIESARENLDELTFRQEFLADYIFFQGRAYYPFSHKLHCQSLQYNSKLPLIFCFDFNISPGVAVVCQEQLLPGVTEKEYDARTNREYDKPVIGTGIIGEVYIPQNSNTIAVCNKLIYDWRNHEGEIHIYGDATGGAGGSAQVEGSDWDLVRKMFAGKWGGQTYYFLPTYNPRQRVRVNAMNSRLMSSSGVIRMMIDFKCEKVVRDLDGVRLLDGGSGELDKRADPMLSHLTDALGYIAYRFPVEEQEGRSLELLW